MNRKFKIALFSLNAFTIFLLLSSSRAEIPKLLNYQGRLTDNSETTLTGSYSIVFSIYDSASGGNLLWSEIKNSVQITDGLFSVLLNPATLYFDKPYWLGVKVGNDAEMSPRQQIASAGSSIYSMTSGSSTYATASASSNYAMASGTASYSTNSNYSVNSGTSAFSINSDMLDGKHLSELLFIKSISASGDNISISSTPAGDYTLFVSSSGSSGQWTTSDSNIYYNSGNVGIGTMNPGALLDVQGAAQFGTDNVNLIDSTGKIAGISSTYFASLDGSTLTNLNASNLASGTIPTGRISGSYTGITGVGTLTSGTWQANSISTSYTDAKDTTDDSWVGTVNVYTTSGNVGIGTTNPSQKLHVVGASLFTETIYSGNTNLYVGPISSYGIEIVSADTNGQVHIGATGSNGYIRFRTGGSDKMRITASGNVGIGTASPGSKLSIDGNMVIGNLWREQSGPTNGLAVQGNVGINLLNPSYALHMGGGAYCTGTTWTNASSREYKENIRELSKEEATAALEKLNPVQFNYKTDKAEVYLGFIAEEVPELVSMKDRKGLNSLDLIAVAIKVIQEQQNEIKNLKEDIDILKEKIK